MMIKGFDEYIKEDTSGAISIIRMPSQKLNDPKFNVQQPARVIPRTGSTTPNHWNNSKSMAGSRYGANPSSSKKRAMSYEEFMEKYDKFSNSGNDKITETDDFTWDSVLGKDSKTDKWGDLEKDMMELVDKYSEDFGPDSYGAIDAMYQVMDGMFQKIKK